LYKAEITIPLAFAITVQNPDDIGSAIRRAVRDAVSDGEIMERAAKDIKFLLRDRSGDGGGKEQEEFYVSTVNLWDEKIGFVKNATLYSESGEKGSAVDADFEPGEGYGTILDE
jgi:CRISPR-associated protein Cas1